MFGRVLTGGEMPGDARRRDQKRLGADGMGGAAEDLALGFVSGVVDLVPVFGEEPGIRVRVS